MRTYVLALLIASILSSTNISAFAEPAENPVAICAAAPTTLLVGGIAYDGNPDIERFNSLIDHHQIPCCFRESLSRLVRAAYAPELRRTVWKRIVRENVFVIDRKTQRMIERAALEANMPLK